MRWPRMPAKARKPETVADASCRTLAKSAAETASQLGAQGMLGLIRAYKLAVSPYLRKNCRFYPSCSDYAAQAIAAHGPAKGSWLAARRICRCHPFSEGGVDPVPPAAPRRGEPNQSAN